MVLTGEKLDAVAHIAVPCASSAESQAIEAKVGAAASASQSARLRVGRPCDDLFLVTANSVIFSAPSVPGFAGRCGMSKDVGQQAGRVRVTSMTGFAWTR